MHNLQTQHLVRLWLLLRHRQHFRKLMCVYGAITFKGWVSEDLV